MRRLLFFLIFIAALGLGYLLNHGSPFGEVFHDICDLTELHYFRADGQLSKWVRQCDREADQLSFLTGRSELLDQIQKLMDRMQVSHFEIYDPSEDRKLWKGEAIDTGLRTRYVEDRLVVYRVIPESSAARAGIRPGYEVLRIDGTTQVTPWDARHRSGWYELKHNGRGQQIHLQAHLLQIDGAPHVTDLNANTALLDVSSFRGEYFNAKDWRVVVAKFQHFPNLIIDLRENAGGNFVAMLRALSTFDCRPTEIGSLFQPRKAEAPSEYLIDDLVDDHQIDQLDQARTLKLRTFPKYGCYRGKITALVGPNTSSVAEIFAYGLSLRKNARVWGAPTAGDVILAVWYDLPELGPGFSFSIPEAEFLTLSHQQLEGRGVEPSRELHYDLVEALKGEDSWIKAALR